MNRSITSAGHLTLALCLSLFLTAGSTRAEEGKKAPIWATVPFFHWVEQTSVPLEQFTFFVNGVQAERSEVLAVKYQESLHVRFHLPYEKETTVEIRRQGESIYRAVHFYAPTYERSIVPDPTTYLPFHTAAREKPCQGCHRLTVKPSDYDPPEVKEQVCYPCHRHRFDAPKTQHKRDVIRWRCLQCHRAPAKPSRWSPNQPLKFTIESEDQIAQLCYKCHKKLAARVKGYRYLHGPIGMGGCTMCHNPHASNFPKPILNEVTNLCVNCHEMKEVLQETVVHQVIKTKGCTACHHPHGSQYPLQLRDTVNKLCTSCHLAIAKQGDNHPVQGHPVQVKGSGREKREKLNCVSCHSPHASAFANLLPEEEMMMLCTHCHPGRTK